MLPRWAVQVTAELKLPVPVTATVNCFWPPKFKVRLAGLRVMVDMAALRWMRSCPLAALVESLLLVATITWVPSAAGAM